MYVQLYITVGLKEIPKGNGGGGGPPLGAWASADSRGVGGTCGHAFNSSATHARMHGTSSARTWLLFSKKGKTMMSEIVC